MKFYLKYGLNLNYLLTYVAETKVILREIYSILIGNDSLLKRPGNRSHLLSPSNSILRVFKITLRVQDIDSDQRTRYYPLKDFWGTVTAAPHEWEIRTGQTSKDIGNS